MFKNVRFASAAWLAAEQHITAWFGSLENLIPVFSFVRYQFQGEETVMDAQIFNLIQSKAGQDFLRLQILKHVYTTSPSPKIEKTDQIIANASRDFADITRDSDLCAQYGHDKREGLTNLYVRRAVAASHGTDANLVFKSIMDAPNNMKMSFAMITLLDKELPLAREVSLGSKGYFVNDKGETLLYTGKGEDKVSLTTGSDETYEGQIKLLPNGTCFITTDKDNSFGLLIEKSIKPKLQDAPIVEAEEDNISLG